MRLEFAEYEIHLSSPLKVSRETHQTHKALFLRLSDGAHEGFGEATEFSVYGARRDSILSSLKKIAPLLSSLDFTSAPQLWQDLSPYLAENPFAQCALDVAAWDLAAKKSNRSLREFLEVPISSPVTTSITCGLSTPDELNKFLDSHFFWPRVKLKLGNEHDAENLAILARRKPGSLADVNGGWSLERAREVLRNLNPNDLALLEQPLPVRAQSETIALKKISPVPLIGDESFRGEADIETCAHTFDGINVKLLKCGGITPCLKIIELARTRRMKVTIGCMPESSLGASVIAHIAPLFDAADFDSPEFLSNDPAEGIVLRNGVASFPNTPGIGISWSVPLNWRQA